MAKAKKPPPPQVLEAIRAGDSEKVQMFARAGGRANARRLREAKKVAEHQQLDESRLADESLAEYHRQVTLRDARAHHMANLAGVSQE